MLSRSDNDAANIIMQKLGGPQLLTKQLRSRFPEFLDVEIRELIPADGATYKNTASLSAYCRLLQTLIAKSFKFSEQFLELLNINGRTRFTGHRTNYVVPNHLTIWHKTGSTSRCCGETAFISPSKDLNAPGSYFLSVIMDRSKPAFHYEGWISFVAPAVGAIAAIGYEYQRARYGLQKGDRSLSEIDFLK